MLIYLCKLYSKWTHNGPIKDRVILFSNFTVYFHKGFFFHKLLLYESTLTFKTERNTELENMFAINFRHSNIFCDIKRNMKQ